MAQGSYTVTGSSLYATNTADPVTTCFWSATLVQASNGDPTSVDVSWTCVGNGGTDSTPGSQSLSWAQGTSASIDSTGSSNVTVDGTLELAIGSDSGYVTFTGVIVQQDVLSIGASQNDGIIVAVCLYDAPGNN